MNDIYEKIEHPITGDTHSVHSKIGKNLIKTFFEEIENIAFILLYWEKMIDCHFVWFKRH